MKFSPNPIDVQDLIAKVRNSELGLPQFQRKFRWGPRAVADLVRSVARDWPIGTFLLLEGPQQFACKKIESAPRLESQPTLLILDGQQRMTALYQAWTDQSSEVYYIHMDKVLAAGELEDDHVEYQKKNKFNKSYPNLESQARAGIATISTLINEEAFSTWSNFFGPEDRTRYFRLKTESLPGLRSYHVPCVTLPKDVPLLALAKIFETINKTGVKLDAFDLMVARLYPAEFHLRDEWEKIESKNPILRRYRVDGLDLLRVVALGQCLVSGSGVKGVRQSDILGLDAETVKAEFEATAEGAVAVLEFLQEDCGVRSASILPSKTMLLPLAVLLRRPGSLREGFRQDLRKWFWASCFAQDYSQGANTQAVHDARALSAWSVDPAACPKNIENFSLDIEALKDGRSRNEIFVRALMCLLITRGVRDWIEDVQLAAGEVEVELHHVFPNRYLEDLGLDETDIVGNFTPLLAQTNQSLRRDPPAEVLKRNAIRRNTVEGHLIDLVEFEAGNFAEFLEKRAAALHQLICDCLQ